MPDGQQWNPVAEFRQNWPAAGFSDDQILTNLQDPVKFRAAFPNYTGVTDQEIRTKMADYASRGANQLALTQQTTGAATAGGAPQSSIPGSATTVLPQVQPVSRYMPQYPTFNPRTSQIYTTPVAPYGAAASIPRAIGGLAGAIGGAKGGEYVAEKMNLSKSESIWARDIGSLLGSMAGAGSGIGAESLWQNIKAGLGKRIYTAAGELTPTADAIVHPTKMPEIALRTVIPQPGGTGAPLPSSAEFYENRAADLARRTGDVATEGQQSGGVAPTQPSASEYYSNKAADLTKRATQQATLDRAAARASRLGKTITITPSQGMSTSPESVSQMPPLSIQQGAAETSPSTTTTGPQAQIVTGATPKPAAGRIVPPGTQPAPIKGSFWSYPETELRKAVLSGDREAAVIYRMRFNTLPEGAKYLTDVADSIIKGLYRSRK